MIDRHEAQTKVPILLGRALRRMRHRSNLTLRLISQRLGVEESYLTRIERGTSDIRVSTLVRYLAAMGMTLLEFSREIRKDAAEPESDGSVQKTKGPQLREGYCPGVSNARVRSSSG